MGTIETKQLTSKVTRARLYTHSYFILICLAIQPIFEILYKKASFSWTDPFTPMLFLFECNILLSAYFTAFVVLRHRPAAGKKRNFLIKVTGIICVFFLFIGFRWFLDQELAYWLFNLTNYPADVDFSFFFYDNMVYSCVAIFCGFFIRYMDDRYIYDRIKTALEKQNLKLELDFLKSQINPHFLFNTLNNIQSYIVQDEKMKSIELIGRLSEFMRFALYECNEEFISLGQEIRMLADYVELERVRCDDRVKINFEVKGNFDSYQIPPLLLMPFVENAFKHGADMQLSQSWINILIEEQENELHLLVKNNFNPLVLPDKKNSGIGLLRIINMRWTVMNLTW